MSADATHRCSTSGSSSGSSGCVDALVRGAEAAAVIEALHRAVHLAAAALSSLWGRRRRLVRLKGEVDAAGDVAILPHVDGNDRRCPHDTICVSVLRLQPRQHGVHWEVRLTKTARSRLHRSHPEVVLGVAGDVHPDLGREAHFNSQHFFEAPLLLVLGPITKLGLLRSIADADHDEGTLVLDQARTADLVDGCTVDHDAELKRAAVRARF
mmetsp:Transcript_111916/g.301946  ORF Transcript_111916/g.301946 Transcript_111916/m.301946 type:complete len:211 (-) Transcript_111916:170-802(-)